VNYFIIVNRFYVHNTVSSYRLLESNLLSVLILTYGIYHSKIRQRQTRHLKN